MKHKKKDTGLTVLQIRVGGTVLLRSGEVATVTKIQFGGVQVDIRGTSRTVQLKHIKNVLSEPGKEKQ